MILKGKKILLGVSGGIAAYKCPELLRSLVTAGSEVEVVLTKSAKEFVTPLTLETVSGQRVHQHLFPEDSFSAAIHIDLADWCDVLLIAPATANILAKIRAGIGDDLLTTICLAGWRKTVLAPAMNSNMWFNPATQENLKVLQERGYFVIAPDEGDLACGYSGIGRLPDVDILHYWLRYYLTPKANLEDKKVLITAGRTEESIDRVRILTNRSSAKMGFALAEQAFFRGASVTLIAGPNTLPILPGITYIPVTTAQEMADEVMHHIAGVDVVIAAAAVSDYRAKKIQEQKIKKSAEIYTLEMLANIDILASLHKKNPKALLAGFALETENALENAGEKLRKKHLDLIAVNLADALASDSTHLKLMFKDGTIKELPRTSKSAAADEILNEIERLV
jgi:phosphopantothenoylcysteine decarboxylase/phosphopantothenate--cysteine ligase